VRASCRYAPRPLYRLNAHSGGDGSPLLLIHGLGANWRSWAPLLMHAEAERHVIAPDLPGFGESPPLPDGRAPTVAALTDAVEADLDRRGVELPAVAGNSLGGWIALELAKRGRARSVVAISPAGMWTERERAWADRFIRTSHALGSWLARHPWLLRSRVVAALAIAGVTTRPWQLASEEVAYGVAALARSNLLPTHEQMIAGRLTGLEQIECPVLVAWGTRDLLLPMRQAPRVAARIPRCELRELAGLGHIPMSDDPDGVSRMILDFTREPAAAAPRSTPGP